MTTSGRICWAANCKSSLDKNPHLQFFPFPTDRTLSTQWCISSGCAHLTKYNRRTLIRRGAALCEKHFLPSQFTTPPGDLKAPKQLLWNAIPTVFPIPLKGPEEDNVKAQKRKLGGSGGGEDSSEEGSMEIVTSTDKVDVEDYEMAALPTFGRERLIAIAKKQWHEIKRLRTNVRNLERALVSKIILDETYLLDLLQRNFEGGPLLDRVTDIIVGDDDDESIADEDA